MEKSKENYLCKLESEIAKIQAYNVPFGLTVGLADQAGRG